MKFLVMVCFLQLTAGVTLATAVKYELSPYLKSLDPSLASCTPRLEWDIMYEYDNTNGNKMLNVAYEEADRSWRVAEEDGKEIAVTYQTPIPFNVRISGNLIFAREPGIGMTGFSTKISPGIRKVFLVEVVTCGHFSFKLSHFKPMEYDRDGRTPHRNMDVNTRRKGRRSLN